MRENKVGRWVARSAVTLGLGAALAGGAAVITAGAAQAAPTATAGSLHVSACHSATLVGTVHADKTVHTKTTSDGQIAHTDDVIWD